MKEARARRPLAHSSAPSPTRTAVLALAACAALTGGCDKIREKLGGGGSAADGGSTSIASEPVGALTSFLGGDGFEGEITMVTSGTSAKGAPKTMIYGVKRPKLRVDFAEQAPALADNPMMSATTAVIIDPTVKKAWALMPAQKRAMVIDFDRMKEMQRFAGASAPDTSTPPQIVKTGKSDVVAGIKCDEWQVIDARSINEACVAEGVTWFDPMSMGSAMPEYAWGAALAGANRFPLRVVSKDKAGVEKFRATATKVEKKSLADDRFVVPADYQVVDPFAMLGNLKGIKGMPGVPPFAPPKPTAK